MRREMAHFSFAIRRASFIMRPSSSIIRLMEKQETHTKHPNYVGIFIILGVLTVVEVLVSQYLSESVRIPILLLLAAAKALLVALYYMHLKFDSRIFAFFFAMAIFLLAIPFALILLLVQTPLTGPTH